MNVPNMLFHTSGLTRTLLAAAVVLVGALLVAGTTSDAGKSMVVAGLCRLLARKGVRVAPFKAQNMSNNSAVTVEGGEIGRAQAMQARAAGLAPSVRFNPILLKPGGDRTSQLVVRGVVAGTVAAGDYFTRRTQLAGVVADELAALRSEFDVVICEGAGSPAEINLRATDVANMGLARAADILLADLDDLLALMLQPGPDGTPILDDLSIRNQIATFMVAGQDTTSTVMPTALYSIVKNPAVLHRAQTEADAVFGNRSDDGDSGVSSRVFAAFAAHIGDSRPTRHIRRLLIRAGVHTGVGRGAGSGG